MRGTWWRSCGDGGAFMAGVSSFGCGDSRNDALKEGNLIGLSLSTRFVVDLEMWAGSGTTVRSTSRTASAGLDSGWFEGVPSDT